MGMPHYNIENPLRTDADQILLEKLQFIKQIIEILPSGVFSMCTDKDCVDSCNCGARTSSIGLDNGSHVHCEDDVSEWRSGAEMDISGDDKTSGVQNVCVGVVEKYTYEMFCNDLNVQDRYVLELCLTI